MSDPTTIRLAIDPGFPQDDELRFRVSPSAAADLRATMENAGVFTSEHAEFSHGRDLIIYGAAFGTVGGLSGLAAVLKAVWGRHKDKKFLVSYGDTTIDLSGRSAADVDDALSKALSAVHQMKLARDAEWRRCVATDEAPEANESEA